MMMNLRGLIFEDPEHTVHLRSLVPTGGDSGGSGLLNGVTSDEVEITAVA